MTACPMMECKKALEEASGNVEKAAEILRITGAAKAVKKAEREAKTVADLVDEYLEKWARPRKRSADEDERILRKDIIPKFGERKAKDITRRDIIALLDGIVERGAPIGANRALACIRRMFTWAVERDILTASPCVSIRAPSKENCRDRTLSDSDIHTFWHGLDNAGMTEATRLALKFQLATAQRRGEVVAAEWSELDRDNGLWTIPAEKAKNGERHIVPLSPLALGLLDAIEAIAPEAKPDAEPSQFLFPSRIGDKPISPPAVSRALRRNLDRIGIEDVTPHDLRRTAATAMAATGVARIVLAKVLNHVDRSVTGRYDKHKYLREKRAALERWGRELEEIIAGRDEPSKVVELAERRQ